MSQIIEPNQRTYPNFVYYNDDHSRTPECSKALADILKVTWTTPSTWQDLVTELEAGCELLAFHTDMILKSSHSTEIEFIDAILTIIRFMPKSKNLKIGVIINRSTPLSLIRNLQKTPVQGLLLDLNDFSIEETKTAANAFLNGIPYWPRHVIDQLSNNVKKPKNCSEVKLTIRQEQVFRMIKERGASNKVIAKALGISESTVKLHITEIFKKYGVRNRTQLAVFSDSI